MILLVARAALAFIWAVEVYGLACLTAAAWRSGAYPFCPVGFGFGVWAVRNMLEAVAP